MNLKIVSLTCSSYLFVSLAITIDPNTQSIYVKNIIIKTK